MAEWVPSILLFVIAGLLIAYSVREYRQALHAARRAKASTHWPTVPGHVIASTVQTILIGSEGDGLVHYLPEVHFTYVVGDATYSGSTIAFRDLRSWKNAAAAVVARYPVGSEVAVHYNPNDPGECVLEAGSAGVWKRLIWAAFGMVVGVGIVATGVVIPLFRLAS